MYRETVEMLRSPQFWRMAVLWTVSVVVSYLRLLFSSRSYSRRRFSADPNFKVKRPICVITGATSGLGLAAAKELALEGYYVILAGRNSQLLSKVVEEIKDQERDAYVESFQVDLSSYISIKSFEISLRDWIVNSGLHPSIQILINNAGILAKSQRITTDGFDEMMETNYIGAFIMTNLLLPLLKNSPLNSRVVNLTSFTHRCVSKLDVHRELFGSREARRYPFASTYENSKLCMLLFSYELNRRICEADPTCTVSVMAADPGVVETNIMREIPPFISRFAYFVLRILNLLQEPESGASSVIDAALAPHDISLSIFLEMNKEASGKYFFGGKGRTIKSSLLSYNTEIGNKLWSVSLALFRDLQQRNK